MRSVLIFGLVLLSTSANAQETSVGGMGQGEASINVRSDVKLGIKGTAGTTSERLAKLGEAVGGAMSEIRACYRKQVAASPEVIGGLRVTLALPEKGKPQVDVTSQDAEGGKALVACVTKALQKASFDNVGRPAAALLTLDFDNSRARGQAMMNERTAQTSQVEVQTVAGQQQAVWSTDGNAVTFTVRSDAASARENVELVMRGFREGYAGFLDCRRHCEKGGLSPEGDIEAAVQIDRQGKSKVTLGKISVAHERAPRCAERAFRQVQFDKPKSVARATVTVHFAK